MPLMRMQEIMQALRAGGRLNADDWSLVCELTTICLARETPIDAQAERRRASDRERAKVRRQSADNPQSASIIKDNNTEGGVGETKSAEHPQTILRTVVDESRAKAIVEHRRAKRSPLKTHSARLLAKQLANFPDPNAAADEMIERGWQTIKPEWMKNGNFGEAKATKGTLYVIGNKRVKITESGERIELDGPIGEEADCGTGLELDAVDSAGDASVGCLAAVASLERSTG